MFKGGTCLKKCHFETYRFSEDLDFTLQDESQLNQEFLLQTFGEIATWIYDHTGIEIAVDRLRFDIYRNSRSGLSCEGRVYCRGPLQPRGSLPRIKLDLTADELLMYSPNNRFVAHPYTDFPDGDNMNVYCCAFEELFGEKIRALGDRARSRDLYDVINLSRSEMLRPTAAVLLGVVRQKCSFKGIPIPSFETLEEFRDDLLGDWKAMLGHQLPALPPFESFWSTLPEFFAWLERDATPEALARIPMDAEDEVVHEPARGLNLNPQGTAILEIVRFAASNRLCVDLSYNESVCRIEPYSLRRTRSGNLLLHAFRADSNEHRSYRVDRIQGAKATEQTFAPKYVIELALTGPLLILPARGGR